MTDENRRGDPRGDDVPAPGFAPPGGDPSGHAPHFAAPPGGDPSGRPPYFAAPPGYASPPYGSAPSDPAAGGPQWTPPVKPGLIPLRPLAFGTILGAPYQLLRRNPRPTFGVSLLIQGVVLFGTLVVIGAVGFAAFSRIDFATSSADAEELAAGAVGWIVLAALIPLAFSLVAATVMQGIIVIEVSRQSLGERLRFGQLWGRARGRIGALLGYTVAYTLAIVLAIVLIVAVAVGLAVAGGGPAIAIGVLLGIGLGLGLLVLVAWLGTKLAFVPSVLLLERTSVPGAMSRSWQLTDGAFWKVFGILALVMVMLNIGSSIAGAPLQLVSMLVPSILTPTGDPTAGVVILVVVTLLSLIVTAVVSAVILVIQSATTALLYIDQRMRKEGLDLELARYVEARQLGSGELADPFRVDRTGSSGLGHPSPAS